MPDASEMIDFVPSRKRVIAIINDLKQFTGALFPAVNGKKIANAFVVVEGEPELEVKAGGVNWQVYSPANM